MPCCFFFCLKEERENIVDYVATSDLIFVCLIYCIKFMNRLILRRSGLKSRGKKFQTLIKIRSQPQNISVDLFVSLLDIVHHVTSVISCNMKVTYLFSYTNCIALQFYIDSQEITLKFKMQAFVT